MSTHVILVDLLAVLFVFAGFNLAFRQAAVKGWLNAARAQQGRPALRDRSASGEEDPAHYAMIIFGTMMLAFGVIIFAFTTSYALMT